MIVRTHTPILVEREPGVRVMIRTHGPKAGSEVVLSSGDELVIPDDSSNTELVLEVDLRGMSSSKHPLARLRLHTRKRYNADGSDDSKQLELLAR